MTDQASALYNPEFRRLWVSRLTRALMALVLFSLVVFFIYHLYSDPWFTLKVSAMIAVLYAAVAIFFDALLRKYQVLPEKKNPEKKEKTRLQEPESISFTELDKPDDEFEKTNPKMKEKTRLGGPESISSTELDKPDDEFEFHWLETLIALVSFSLVVHFLYQLYSDPWFTLKVSVIVAVLFAAVVIIFFAVPRIRIQVFASDPCSISNLSATNMVLYAVVAIFFCAVPSIRQGFADVPAEINVEDTESKRFLDLKQKPEGECGYESSSSESQNLTKDVSTEISREDTGSKSSAELKRKPDSECGDESSPSRSQNLTENVTTKTRLEDAEGKSSVEDRESVLFGSQNPTENVAIGTRLESAGRKNSVGLNSKQDEESALFERKNTSENVPAESTPENVEAEISTEQKQRVNNELFSSESQNLTKDVSAEINVEDTESKRLLDLKQKPDSECGYESSSSESQNLIKAGSAEISLEDTESKGFAELKHKPDSECGDQSSPSVKVSSQKLLTPLKNKEKKIIDDALHKMSKTRIFALKDAQLEQDSLKYFCSKLDSEYEMKKLKFKSCSVDKMFLSILHEKMPKVKVTNLDLSGNELIDLSLVRRLMTKLGCASLNISGIKFNKDQVKSLANLNVRRLILHYSELLPTTITATSFAEILKNRLEELSLVDSNITCEQFEDLAQNLNDCDVILLRVLDLTHIKLEKESLEAISIIINKSTGCFEKLSLFGCGLNGTSLMVFTHNLQKKIRDLVIGHNKNISKNGIQAVIDIASKAQVQKLGLSSLSLEAWHIKELAKIQIEVPDVDLTENPEIDAADVGNLVRMWKVRKLNISECYFLKVDFDALAKNMGDYKLESLYNNEVSSI